MVRPDWVSATVTARSTGQRVEVLSEKSETGRVWVFPDGSVEEEQAAAAVRFLKEDSDQWRDIDTTLQATSEGVGPVSMPVDVQLGTAGEPAVVFDAGAAGEVKFALPDVVLPTPVLDGPTAVYPEVLAGVDLSVEVRSAGFEVLWIVKTPEAATTLLEEYGVEEQLRLPTLLSAGGDVTADSGGVVQVQDAAGDVVGSFADPVMWDTNTETPGEQGVVEPVVMEVAAEPVGASGTPVDVVADGAWLSDPERVFPVVIDPTYTLDDRIPAFDAFVQQGITSDQSGSAELKLGNNGQGQIARTFMNFDAALFKGRQVISSTLSLYESWSYNCTARPFSVYAAGLASTSTNWANQPSVGVKHATLNVAAGYSASCPGARVQLDTTSYAKAMSTASTSQVGMMLRADNETDVVSWKRFHSSKGQNKPVISVRYNRAPNVPAVPTVGGLTNAMTQSGVKPFVAGAPKLSVVVRDADANTSKANFAAFTSSTSTAAPVTLCQSGLVASGGTATCTAVAGVLKDNTTVWIRATLGDEVGGWSGWGPAQEARVAFATPVTPTITCPTANGSWGDTAKPKETCVITMPVNPAQATSAPVKVRWSINGAAWQEVTKTQPSPTSPNSHGVQMGGSDGVHALRAVTVSPTGKQSATQTYQFGYGKAKLTSPGAGMVTHGEIEVKATGQPKGAAPTVKGSIQWRIKGSNDNAWTSAPNNAWSTTATTSGTTFSGRLDTAALEGLADGSGVKVAKRVSTVIQLRVVLDYGTSGKTNTDPVDVVRVPHAFGAGFPVTEAGGGQVALWTGELQISDTDAQLSTPDGGLSISRVHSTFAGDPNVANAVFGPGWVAAFDGDGSGTSGMELIDNTLYDGTLVLVDADGTALPFSLDGKRRASAFASKAVYKPVGADAEASGLRLSVAEIKTGDTTISILVTDEDAITTRYSAPMVTAATEADFRVVEVIDPVVEGKTTYTHDTTGRVTRITAGLPDGVTSCPSTGSAPGCRALELQYDTNKRVKSITAEVNGEASKTLATYIYDTFGRMTKATDTITGLSTTYTWTGSTIQPRLATITEPGQDPVTYTYTSTTPSKLARVTRPVPATDGGGTSQLAAFLYDIAPADISGLGALEAQFANYNLPRTASKAFAVFGPDTPTAPVSAGDTAWRKADVWLTDQAGYTIHEARYGAGQWQLSANIYDDSDNIISTWDTRATAAIRTGEITDIAAAATNTVYNTDITTADGKTVLVPSGTRVTDVYSPAAMILPAGATEEQMLRRHLHTDYDQGAPNNGINPQTQRPYGLATTATVTAKRLDGTVVETLTTTKSGYTAPVVDGTITGWDLGLPTSTTLDMGTAQDGTKIPDLISQVRYDKKGRTVEERKPGSTGTDAATRKTVYWSAGPNPRDAQCGNKAPWAGYLCKVGPAAQPPATQPPTGPVPVTLTSDYQWDGQALTQIETSGSATRTTTTTLDDKRRPKTVSTTVIGLPDSISEPTVTTTYFDTTGQVKETSSARGSTAMTYDTWGRQTTYTTTTGGTAETTTTTYNQLGEISKITTPHGETTMVWDGTDAQGNTETRGLLTEVTNTVNGYTTTATAAYDAHGELTLEKLPGEITRNSVHDLTGELITQSYSGQITNPDTGQVTEDVPWVAWSISANAAGQITKEYNPDGPALTGANAQYADLNYSYDKAGRLTTVTDLSTPNPDSEIVCSKRTYSFDERGNRTTHTAATAEGGQCTNPVVTATVTRSYDIADRPITGAGGQGDYTYDPLGRQTTIPAADAPNPTDGDIYLEYFDGDAARRIRQGNNSTTYDLDTSGRRTTQASYTGGTLTNPGTLTEKTVNHYVDDSDNPGWITHTKNGQTATTVYGDLVSDDLSLSIITDTFGTRGELALTTPRGDIAATITLTNPNDTATGLDSWTRYTEYGHPTTLAPTGISGAAGNGYGWLGAHQRTTTGIGITLMGARLYNPTTGLFTSPDPIHGGNETTYTYPNDPINKQDTTGQESRWRKVFKGVVIAGAVVGALACGASIVCGVAVGAAAGLGTYAAAHAGSSRWKWRGALRATAIGGASGLLWGSAASKIGWKLSSRFKFGVRFSKGSARGTDLTYRGRRVFGLHSHKFPGQKAWQVLHHHRRPGIKWHRPWEGPKKTPRRR
ncbi:MAG: DNRLRE domain-containing protein [Propionibacteriaceae bacterium]|nr:DNRLRE domain-containing protein [Propionibacteriaceae bacterium]